MSKPIVFMFSGQGSQYYHMGIDLFRKNSIFKKHLSKLNDIAYNILGESIMNKMYDYQRAKSDRFDRTLYTHPAIFMVQYSLAQVLIEEGIKPDYVLGTSLGEFVSATIAGIIEPEEALIAVINHAKLVEEKCREGGMTAIIENPNLYDEMLIMKRHSELVSINYDKHFVIAGEKTYLKTIEEKLKENNVMFQSLPVSYGFHSIELDVIEEEYLELTKEINYNKAKVNFISCIDGGKKEEIPYDYLWKATREPINFTKAINGLEERGNYYYLDLGPSGTLANFANKNINKNNGSMVFNVITPFGQEIQNLEKIKEIFNNRQERKGDNMLTYVFPGQGSQQKGMGKELFEEYSELTKKADEILGYSIEELCLEDPNNVLGETQYTQPALYVVNALSYLKKIKEGKTPDYVAGHSLGEYSALFAAGAFDFETGLKLVKKRGELMSKASGGGMAAVIGLDEEKVKEVLKENNLHSIDVANYNTPTQIVISGRKEDIERAKEIFETAGARMYAILKVSGAFHSRYMEQSKEEFENYLKEFELKETKIPVISNIKARPYKYETMKEDLANQITNSVKWTESIRYLMGKGEMEFEQIGPGMVVTGLVKKIQQEAEPLIILEEEIEKKEEVEEEIAVTKIVEVEVKENDIKIEQISEEEIKIEKEEQIEAEDVNNKAAEGITAQTLGNDEFKKQYNLKYAYLAGSMYKGIASKEMVVKMGQAGLMGFFGTGGLSINEVEESIKYIQNELKNGEAYGMNLLYDPAQQEKEEQIVDLYLKYGIKNIEASAYMSINYPLVKYRLQGLKRDEEGNVYSENKIIAKVSRPEVAESFLSPAPERIINKLLEQNKITKEQAELSKEVPIADAISIEADSGGHTDQGVAYALMPAIIKLRDEMVEKYGYKRRINVGAAGGIGTPEAAAAAFVLGADFIVTGSINQCTVEARTSEQVKDLLQQANVQDTEYAPAGDMFEMGAKVQVLKKGLFFPARANKLYELYRQYNSLDEIDDKTKKQLEERYFGKTFEEIFEDAKSFYPAEEIEKANKNPKQKMAMIFKWYFGHSTRLALSGSGDQKVNYQVHCGPSLGAFNQWVKGSEMEDWRNRNVDKIAIKILDDTATLLNNRFRLLMNN